MQTFISETLDDLLKTNSNFENTVIILPSQRAGVFVKQAIKEKITSGFLPEIINIDQFIERVSGFTKVDSIQLLFHFFAIYKDQETVTDSFDVFSSWATTVLQDFNEIDQHLIDTKDIFVYLRDIQRLRKWSTKGTFKETSLMKDHFSFMEKLNTYYEVFSSFLKDHKIGYQGLIYREAVKKVDDFIVKDNEKEHIFIGFNALNKAEIFLFQKMLSSGNSEVYWDIDRSFLESNHQAGYFIRKYKNEWKYFEKNPLKIIGNNFSSSKNIEIIGSSKNISQIKHVGEILNKLPNHKNTAVVLADETLLPITLNSLPKKTDGINITMGYPLKNVPSTSLFLAIFQLFITQEKLQKNAQNLFYHKDVVRLFSDPYIYKLLDSENGIVHKITHQIAVENKIFVSVDDLKIHLSKLDTEVKNVLTTIFSPLENTTNFIDRILLFIAILKEKITPLEKEYLFRYHTVLTQLKTLEIDFNYFQDLKTLFQFFKQLIQSEVLAFKGDPLQGLQLMGMLETRVLDFENVIITSVNEGVLPTKAQQKSFIPFDVKTAFGIPTYKEKDAIFSYHFFRLLQRAKNVFIVYNTEHDSFGNGEKSRFVMQLEMMRNDITSKFVGPKVNTKTATLKIVKKNEKIIKKLEELAKKGISPSTLTNYLYNPISFYKQKVLKIRQLESIEETVEANTMGTVVHRTLDALYQPFIAKFLQVKDIQKMEKKSGDLIEKYFKEEFKNSDLTTGKNRLIYEVANRFVHNFLAQEKKLLSNLDNQLKIVACEERLSAEINVNGLDFPIKIHGEVDRVDELNGELRIIDYKTGKVETSNLKVADFEKLRSLKHHKAIQVMLYAFLFTKSKKHDFSKPIKAGVFSFKNLNSGFLTMNFSTKKGGEDSEITEEKLEDFIDEIGKYLLELYDIEIPFEEPANLPY